MVQQAEESMQPEEQDLDVDEQRAALKSFKFLKEHSPEDSGNEQEDLTTEFEVSLAAVSDEDSEPVKHKKNKTKKVKKSKKSHNKNSEPMSTIFVTSFTIALSAPRKRRQN